MEFFLEYMCKLKEKKFVQYFNLRDGQRVGVGYDMEGVVGIVLGKFREGG